MYRKRKEYIDNYNAENQDQQKDQPIPIEFFNQNTNYAFQENKQVGNLFDFDELENLKHLEDATNYFEQEA